MAMEGYVIALLSYGTFFVSTSFTFLSVIRKYNSMQCFIRDITRHKYFNMQKELAILPTQDHLDYICI